MTTIILVIDDNEDAQQLLRETARLLRRNQILIQNSVDGNEKLVWR